MQRREARINELANRMERLLGQPSEQPQHQQPEEVGTGTKRPAERPIETPSADDGPPPQKRARFFDSIRRRFSRAPSEDTGGQKSTATLRGSVVELFNRSGARRLSFGPSPGPTPSTFQKIRICLIGDKSAGKTALVHRLRTGLFVETDPSGSYYWSRHPINIDGEMYLLEVWDVPGGLEAGRSSPLTGASFDAAVICFSLESEENLGPVKRRWPQELKAKLVEAPIFVMGLKGDLRPVCPTLRLRFLNEAIPVSAEKGQKTAAKVGACAYFECSSKSGDGVEAAFREVARLALLQREGEDPGRADHGRRERARELASQAGRRVSWLFCGNPTALP